MIIALRRILLAQQIARKPAVGKEQSLGGAEKLRLAEIV